MRSIFLIFAAAVCFSPCLQAGTLEYSLWPRRPEEVARAFALLNEQADEQEILKLLEPHLNGYGIGGREARKIVGRLNAGRYLSGQRPNMEVYTVKSGDNFFRIADRLKCPVDLLMYVNGMLDPSALKIGQKLKAPPLNYRMEIRPGTKEILVWDRGVLVACYPVLKERLLRPLPASTKVLSRTAFLEGQPVARNSSDYASADKELTLADGQVRIASRLPSQTGDSGFQLSAADANELALFIVPGNEVTVVWDDGDRPAQATPR